MSDVIVYDKAKYHYEGTFPPELPQDQAFVHIGMLLGWLADEGMLSEQMYADFADEIESFEERKITGAKLLKLCGGALASDMLNKKGNDFVSAYFKRGQYLDDYTELVAQGLPSLYHAKDTWENYGRMAHRINRRYHEWCTQSEEA